MAGIAHVSADPKLKDMYFAVNRDLTIAAAKKAKEDGAKQFIFMSSIIVYGNSARVGKERWITASTKETPADFYGQSKLEAEQGICPLADENFKVAVLRPPMIYGRDSKGNYRKLSALAKSVRFSPISQIPGACCLWIICANLSDCLWTAERAELFIRRTKNM